MAAVPGARALTSTRNVLGCVLGCGIWEVGRGEGRVLGLVYIARMSSSHEPQGGIRLPESQEQGVMRGESYE